MKNTNSIFLSLTTKCNIRCGKCWRFDVFGNGKDISNKVLNKFMELFSDYKGKVIIGSGENLVSKSIEEYINWSVKNQIKTTILTNGLIFDKFIDKPNFFDKSITWGLTMDGFINDEIKKLQIGMDVERVKQNIITIKNKYPTASFYLNITHTKNNLDSTLDFINFAHKINIDQVYITQLKLFEGLDDSITKDQVNDIESSRFLKVMNDAEILAKQLNIKFFAPLKSQQRDCFNNITTLSPIIHGNGNIIFCYGRDGKAIGNILTDEEAWRKHLNYLLQSDIKREEWCSKCDITECSDRGYYYIPGQKK